MSQSVLEFEAFPGRTLTLALFKDCTNAKAVRAAIRDSSMPEFAYINAAVVVDPFLVHLAGYRALTAESSGRLNTKSLHTELIYDISGTKHVGESLKRFGITDECKSLLVARFDCKPEEIIIYVTWYPPPKTGVQQCYGPKIMSGAVSPQPWHHCSFEHITPR
ncbi:hypothetical protein Vafri_1493 [Volvox africanus]|nr:hypothetical protein Vafri_1493 [Volvox africanus]